MGMFEIEVIFVIGECLLASNFGGVCGRLVYWGWWLKPTTEV